MADERLKEDTRKFYDEVFNRGNYDKINEYVDANMVEHEQLPPGTPPGREGFRQWLTNMRRSFPDMHIELQGSTVDGDRVWTYLRMTGTNKGEMMGMPATGKSVRVDGFDILRYSNGKIVEHWGVFDNLGLMTQLGVIQPMGQQQQRR
jgi:steroid delta-isomerase-like uncharacterized protein